MADSRRGADRLRDESGIALVSVIGLTFAMSLLVVATLAYSLGGLRDAAREEDWTAALGAADAGIDDYLFRINNSPSYWQYNAANLPPDGNMAFVQDIAFAGPDRSMTFTYSIDTAELPTQGIIKVTSIGRSQGQERSVEVQLRRRGFLDYLYFTDLETRDPALYPTSGTYNRTWAQANCNIYLYEGRNTNCTSIYFAGADAINGSLHTNDTIQVSGSPQFLGETSSSWAVAEAADCSHQRWVGNTASANNPGFPDICSPTYDEPLQMPPSNAALKLQTNGTLGNTGCLFTGPTWIKFEGVSAGTAQMRVMSPLSTATNCGVPTNGTLTAFPANGVLYVQNVPASPTDPNYTTACQGASPAHPLAVYLTPGDLSTYNCADGDAWVWGEVGDPATVGSENDIYFVEDITYTDPAGLDVLGLVANNYVQLYHPIACTAYDNASCNLRERFSRYPTYTTISNITLNAAIIAVDHSFTVQNYRSGSSLGTLTIRGAIAQRYRGPVGLFYTGSGATASGVSKSYNYDDRLRYISPPHFLDPVTSAWKVIDWKE